MTGILAIETATEACSVAVWRDGALMERHEVVPRQHSQRLFGMLRELFPAGGLRSQGIDAIAYGCGPGSFTGLRIAAAAVQGLSFADGLPAVAVNTLACLAQTALRTGVADFDAPVLSVIDARIDEVYYGVYSQEEGHVVLRQGPAVSPPQEVTVETPPGRLCAVGSGCRFLAAFPAELKSRLQAVHPAVYPAARDLVPLALDKLSRGEIQSPAEVQPLYVRDEVSWKKLPEQGRRS